MTKIENVKVSEVFTIPGKEGKYCRKGYISVEEGRAEYIVAIKTDMSDSTTLLEGNEVELTGEIIDIEKLIGNEPTPEQLRSMGL